MTAPTKLLRMLSRRRFAAAVAFALSLGIARLSASLAAEPPPAPSSPAASPSGAGCQACVPRDGFSRADQFPGPEPIVTTRLYTLDDRHFPKGLPATVEDARAHPFEPANAFEELDDIYGLMALAVVHADWQEKSGRDARGHNIGGIIVDGNFEVVNWERNSNGAMCNGTQHGEVRTMLKHLNRTGSRDQLKNHQIYTSLEPCMMCSGMMMQSEVLRTVYMQTDNGFGKNLERLTLDTQDVPVRFDGEDTHQHGYWPAARPVISSLGSSEFRVELDVAWRNASANPNPKFKALTVWLASKDAQDIFRRARAKFENYPLRFGDQKARAKFIVPAGGDAAPTAPDKFTSLEATKTNAQLYAQAKAFFSDPGRGIIPYEDPDGPNQGTDVLVEDEDNVFATRLLESPQALACAEMSGDCSGFGANAPATQTLSVEGTFAGKAVRQERVRRRCP